MAFKQKKQTISPEILQMNLVAKTKPKSLVSEQYRTIRTNTLFSSIDHPIRSLMVTSSNPEEGKSTTVANLAVVFANQNKKVLLIDADMRKPTIHFIFNLPNKTGLTTVLANQADFQEACCETAIENLYVLPSGPVPPNPAELLGSSAMEALMGNIKKQFDYMLFDTPPILAVTDPQVLANQCDGSILVVNSGKTDKARCQKAKDLLKAANGRLLGAVLNNYNTKEPAYYAKE